jgi:ABC-type branched-subunit amino acid transport system permease subunit
MDSIFSENENFQGKNYWSWTLFFVFLALGLGLFIPFYWYLNLPKVAFFVLGGYTLLAFGVAKAKFFPLPKKDQL